MNWWQNEGQVISY